MKRLLTLNDLVKFCEEKQFFQFNSDSIGYQIAVQFNDADFALERNYKNEEMPSMLFTKIKVCHTGLNRNKSYISEKNMKKAIKTLAYRPILAYIHQLDSGEYDFHAHDVEYDDEGNPIYLEKQVGSITADTPFLEYDEQNDKTYVMAYGAIPEEYTMAADIIKEKDGTKVSCELVINDFSYNVKEKYLELNDFYFSGVTLLGCEKSGKEIGEGMEGSRLDIQDFSYDNNSMFSHTTDELSDVLKELNATLLSFKDFTLTSLNNKDNEKGGISKMNEKLQELLEKYSKTVEELDFDYEIMTDEELEAKFVELFESDPEPEPQPEPEPAEFERTCPECGAKVDDDASTCPECGASLSNNDDNDTENFIRRSSVEFAGRTYNFEISLDEILYGLERLVNETYSESDNAYYSVKVYDKYVVMIDYWTGRAFKQSYKSRSGVYTLTGDRVEVFARYLTSEEDAALDEMRSKYAELKAFKDNYDAEQIKAEKQTIINKYEETLHENEKFIELKNNIDNLSVDEIETKCKCIHSDATFAGTITFAAAPVKEQKKTIKVGFSKPVDETNDPYGSLFKDFKSNN